MFSFTFLYNFHGYVTLLFLFRFSWNFHQNVELRNWEWYTSLVVLSYYFTKFHDFSMIIQFFFKFHDFSMHGTFFSDFPGFPWFPEFVGTLVFTSRVRNSVYPDQMTSSRASGFANKDKFRFCKTRVKYLLFLWVDATSFHWCWDNFLSSWVESNFKPILSRG